MSFNTTDFDRLVYQTLAKPGQYVFLVVLLESKLMVGGQQAVRVKATALENCAKGLNFRLFKKHLQDVGQDWDMAVIGLANNIDGSPPLIEDCKRWLEDMERRIPRGDTTGLVIFDVKGKMLSPPRQVPSQQLPPGAAMH